MSTGQTSFKQAVHAMSRDDRGAGGAVSGVSVEEVTAFVDGDLSADDEERLRLRLLQDPEAARLALDYHDFIEGADEAGESLAGDAVEVRWRLLQRRLQRDSSPSSSERLATSPELLEPVPNRLSRALYALAASLVIASAVALFFGERLVRPEIETNLAVAELMPTTSKGEREGIRSRAETSPIEIFSIPPHAESAVLAFYTLDLESSTTYRLELETLDGDPVRDFDGLKKTNGGLTVELPRRDLPPGLYQAEIFGLNGASLVEYVFEVRHAETR